MESWSFNRNEASSVFKSFYSSTSVNQLGEFRNKLMCSRKGVNKISIPSWKVFRNQVKLNVSPKKLDRPRLECYSDTNSFRTSSPKESKSPAWKSRLRLQSGTSYLSGNSSPKLGSYRKVMQILKAEDVMKAVEAISEMDESEFNMLPGSYIKSLVDLCNVLDDKYKKLNY